MQHSKADKHEATVIKRVSRANHDDGHGGAWKVAFADFCLALMCLFLVMWVLAARNQERAEEIMRAVGGRTMDEGKGVMPETMGGPRGSLISREPLPRDPEAQHKQTDNSDDNKPQHKVRYESAADLASLAKVLAQMSQDAGLASNLQSVVTPYGLRVMLHDTDKQGMFERGSSLPNERFRKLLRKMGPLFARIQNQMLIVGHTDSVQYAGEERAAFSNWALSSNRAMAARAHLLGGGMAPDSILQVVGMADRAPLDLNAPTAGVNRRIELLILTSGQAENISAMFGMPTNSVASNVGVDTEIADRAELSAMRARLNRQSDAVKTP